MNAYGTDGGPLGLDPNFKDVFTNWYDNTIHKEMIFFRENDSNTSIETANGPLGLSGAKQGNGRTNPTQNLVDAFLMKDGYFMKKVLPMNMIPSTHMTIGIHVWNIPLYITEPIGLIIRCKLGKEVLTIL